MYLSLLGEELAYQRNREIQIDDMRIAWIPPCWVPVLVLLLGVELGEFFFCFKFCSTCRTVFFSSNTVRGACRIDNSGNTNHYRKFFTSKEMTLILSPDRSAVR